MIVGDKFINMEELRESAKSYSGLDELCIKSVPKYFRHIESICMNQRYLYALYLRKLESIPYLERKEKCEYLLKGIHITGVPTQIIDVNDLLLSINMEKLLMFLKEFQDDN